MDDVKCNAIELVSNSRGTVQVTVKRVKFQLLSANRLVLPYLRRVT